MLLSTRLPPTNSYTPVVLQDWDSSSWSHARAGTTVPREKCRGWCLSHAPLKSGAADFTHSTKNALRPSLERPSYQCPERLSKRFTFRIRTVPPCFLSFTSVLSKVQLRELSYTCVKYIKSTEELREGTFLSAGAPALVSFLLCSRSCLSKILIQGLCAAIW
jgi:hypothetical protein